ncbi:MAG TPA: hypothetical protein VKZ53_11950 [Candidatus Angelobacter sp.]|nr:hypothetical protein [Candidatus Angelobacter sp.]
MKRVIAGALALASTIYSSTACFADFKYTETSKVTGGSVLSMMKVVGVFSKDAKQITQPMNSVISIKGNRMRREDAQGNIQIYDLDGKRFIHIDTQHKTYSVMTFDELRASIEDARKKAAEQQAKSKGQDPQVKLTPKIQVTGGQETKQLLNQTAKEEKIKVEMVAESQDPSTKGQTASMWFTSDAWVASVAGYKELKQFNMRMAKELDWLPGEVIGGNPQISPAMVEFRKETANLEGLPLLQNVSFGMEGTGQPGAQPAHPDSSASNTSSTPTSPKDAIAKGLGGMFGMGKKKKKDDSDQPDANAATGSSTSTASNSFMDMTIEVTSLSTSALESSLFEIPEGYKQVDAKKNMMH